VNKTNSIVEVNGNRYDAVTGKLIRAGQNIKHSTHQTKRKMVDGFTLAAHNRKESLSKSHTDRPKTQAQGLHRPPQKPKTLIRKGLKKPHSSEGVASSNAHNLASKINPLKQLRSQSISKHSGVNRFGHFSSPKNAKPTQPRVEIIRKTHSPSKNSKLQDLPPSLVTSVSHRKLELMLDDALLKANAHKQMMNVSTRRRGLPGKVGSLPRWLSFSLVGLVLLITASFLIYRNLPAVAVYLAASKAQVNASMPTYTPPGFDYTGPLSYKKGAVTMNFKDKINPAQHFSLTQETSGWSSSTIEASGLPKDVNVQSSQVSGTTVYIYGDNNDAMWVNESVLYKLKNKAELPREQVLRIVQGL
jgi:hypothetical protein